MTAPFNNARLDLHAMNAARNLAGLTLPGGWLVEAMHPEPPGVASTVTYTVRQPGGRIGFLKVLDLVAVFADLQAIHSAVGDYLVERDLLLMCGEASLSRVVVAIDNGQVTLEGYLPALATVHYIIFEHADRGDLSAALSAADMTDIAVRFELLHDYAVGLRQLHTHGIAHQDIKPANTLVFRGETGGRDHGKIGDLGRAFEGSFATSHDRKIIPGDRSFAPPEQLYQHQYSESAKRRYWADLYQLGNLIAFTFAAVTMNALLARNIAPEHHWDQFGDGYDAALPYVEEAFASAMMDLRLVIGEGVEPGVASVIEALCEPRADARRHPRVPRGSTSGQVLQRVISDLNLWAVRARSKRGYSS